VAGLRHSGAEYVLVTPDPPDYENLWRQLKYRIEGDAEYARDEARRRGQHEYDQMINQGEAEALARVLRYMESMEAEPG
jgi:hypothetical protein